MKSIDRSIPSLVSVFVILSCLLFTLPVMGQRAPETGSLLVTNATVLTVTNGTLENTDVLVQDGIIIDVGSDLVAPEGVDVIDASGLYLMPGIIDPHTHIAINTTNEATAPVTPEVHVGDVINPYDLSLYRALAGGVTISHVMHGSANVIGGQNQVIKHRYGLTNPEALKMEGAPRSLKLALGENPTRVHGKRGGSGQTGRVIPASRMGVEFVLRDALNQGRRYLEAWERYETEHLVNERAIPPPHNERLEVLADVLRGELIIHCHTYRADETLMVMDVLKDFGIDTVMFEHVNEGFKIAPELAEFGAMATVFPDWWAYKFEVYYSTAYNAAILTRNGVVTSMHSDSAELDRHLYHEAAKTQKYGSLTDDEALALLTINAAKQLGIADRVGSIEVGKDADLVLFEGHPLSIYGIPHKTIVDGIVRFDRENDPDDMRLFIDPEAEIDDAIIWEYIEEDDSKLYIDER